MKTGIYKITNQINGKFYIGSSKDLKIGRWIIDKFLAGTTKKPYKYRFKYKDITE